MTAATSTAGPALVVVATYCGVAAVIAWDRGPRRLRRERARALELYRRAVDDDRRAG